jgi:hypothetical protein
MDTNKKVIWLNRALNAVAALGFTVSGLAAAVSEIGALSEQAVKLGVVPAKWMGLAALIGAVGHIAAKWSKTPSQAIAAAVPPSKAPPPAP